MKSYVKFSNEFDSYRIINNKDEFSIKLIDFSFRNHEKF